MKDLLTFIGGVAVGILAAAGIYAAVDDESDMTCRNAPTDSEEMEDQDEESEMMCLMNCWSLMGVKMQLSVRRDDPAGTLLYINHA